MSPAQKKILLLVFPLLTGLVAFTGWIFSRRSAQELPMQNQPPVPVPTSTIISTPTSSPAGSTTSIKTLSFDEIMTSTMDQLADQSDGELIYESGGNIYVLNTETAISTPLVMRDQIFAANPTLSSSTEALPSDFLVSRDGRYLYFDMAPDQFTRMPNLYIFDFSRNRIVNVLNVEDPSFYEVTGRSPDARYISLYGSTCPCGGNLIIMDVDSGTKLYDGGGGILSPSWNIIAYDTMEYQFGIPVDPVGSYSLYVRPALGKDVSSTLLLKGSPQYSYSPIKWLNEDELVYSFTTYDKPIPSSIDRDGWDYYMQIYANPKSTTWKINIHTFQKEVIFQSSSTERQGYVFYQNTEYSREFEASEYFSTNKIWSAVLMGKWPDQSIYLFNRDKTKKIKIAEGNSVSWILQKGTPVLRGGGGQ